MIAVAPLDLRQLRSTNMENSQAMLSRSLRIDKPTLEILEAAARERDLGITVYIRMILQSFAANLAITEEAESDSGE